MSERASILLLHIEDDPSLADLFGSMLKREAVKRGWDLQIEWVDTFAAGIQRAMKIPPPDLIILDLGLPDSLPTLTISRIPELEKYGPVHVLTGRTEKGMREAIKALGAGFSDKRDAYGSILETGIATLLAWLPKSHRAHEREERFRAIDNYIAAIQAPISHATD